MRQFWDEQRDRNRASREAWSQFASHRREVTKQLTRGFDKGQRRVCVLGAGNCNDLALGEMLACFAEVHLVDVDEEALAAAVRRQGCEEMKSLWLHGGIDVSGLPLLARQAAGGEAAAMRFETLMAGGLDSSWCERLPGPFDAVASVGLLSQLIEVVAREESRNDATLAERVAAVREHHLRSMLRLLVPGGWGVLIADFVSSDTSAELATVTEDELPRLVESLIAERNFFHGLNPLVLRSMFMPPAALAGLVAQHQLVRPWRWQLGKRVYAVCAVKFQRRPVDGTVGV